MAHGLDEVFKCVFITEVYLDRNPQCYCFSFLEKQMKEVEKTQSLTGAIGKRSQFELDGPF